MAHDTYNAGQVGNQGPNAGKNSTQIMNTYNFTTLLDYDKLADEITQLKAYLRMQEDSDDNDILKGNLAKLGRAVEEKNDRTITERLKAGGTKLLQIAREISCPLIANLLTEIITSM
ncbi:MAG: hypothetical protein LBV33_01650 [Lachnospiraceae bacterium]|jgi:hypothetical protein|nr:hypothetical protein [Lachnospiraceae bacterium]